MAKDPAFLFYPGDYLRDTQCMSERSQVAYDRIMCSHMKNTCVTQAQLNFFTRGFTSDEMEEVKHVLVEVAGGFQIEWVADSILKRREYGESRRKNRKGGKDMITHNNHINTHDEHKENAIENENARVVEDENLIPRKVEKYKSAFDNDYQLDEKVVAENRFSPKNLVTARKEFWNSKELDEEMLGKSYQDVQKHFLNWCRKNKDRIKKGDSEGGKDDGLGDGNNFTGTKSAL